MISGLCKSLFGIPKFPHSVPSPRRTLLKSPCGNPKFPYSVLAKLSSQSSMAAHSSIISTADSKDSSLATGMPRFSQSFAQRPASSRSNKTMRLSSTETMPQAGTRPLVETSWALQSARSSSKGRSCQMSTDLNRASKSVCVASGSKGMPSNSYSSRNSSSSIASKRSMPLKTLTATSRSPNRRTSTPFDAHTSSSTVSTNARIISLRSCRSAREACIESFASAGCTPCHFAPLAWHNWRRSLTGKWSHTARSVNRRTSTRGSGAASYARPCRMQSVFRSSTPRACQRCTRSKMPQATTSPGS
mmetsp:Transcript_70370/g.228765  ORF Transcript_70370/g.228765 Transcript_70370/m.228765 type:complete len:303 (-) Transcript_70370:1605-2513(-)